MTGYAHETSQLAPTDDGVEGNSRLTAATGLLLLGLLAVEGITILSVRGLITWHIFVGIVLIGPLLLKTGSTVYRFYRYYTGAEAYVRKGPPHPILRVLGPLVILSSLTVVGTGLGLLAVRPGDGGLLLLAHKASFIVWVAATTIHVLGHLVDAVRDSWRELHAPAGDPAKRRRSMRVGAVALSLALGVGAAAVVTPTATGWTNRQHASVDGDRAYSLGR
ncbi:MAG: hypothetical protein JWN96_4017 [Mycobacterium sp.]|nr:hypothetical protein [Mycobacterium sp.]